MVSKGSGTGEHKAHLAWCYRPATSPSKVWFVLPCSMHGVIALTCTKAVVLDILSGCIVTLYKEQLLLWTCHLHLCTAEIKGAGDEAEGSAGLASKASVDKADKLIRLSEREQAEGRTGGQAGQRIVYDNAAIERLLDRCAARLWFCA